LTGLLVLGWTSVVAAQPTPRFELSWDAPPGCPTAENVQTRVDALLAGGARAGSVADVRASGQVERVDNGFRLLLTMGVGSTPSSRVIEARTCDELAGAAAIALALLARSTSEEASSPSAGDAAPATSTPGSQVEPPPAAADPTTSKKAPPAEPEVSPRQLRLVIDAPIGLAGWGSLPSAGLGLGAAVGIRWKALRATVKAELWQPQITEQSGFSSRFTRQSGRLEGCLVHAAHDLELGPCLGVAAQRLVAEGIGSEVFLAQSRTTMWVSGAGGLFASLPTPGFKYLRLFGAASVLVSPSRPRFVIDQLGLVHEPALAAPQVDLGCEWIF
jgi:hypothetical protein